MVARAASCVLLLAVLGLTFPSHASAAGAWSLVPGEYYSDLSGALFSTTSVYNAAGTRITPNLRFESRDFASYNELGWKRSLSAVLGMEGRSISGVSGFDGAEITQTGFTAFTLGLKRNLMNGARAAAIEVDWVAPLGYDRQLSGRLGDGRQRLSADLALGSALGHRGFAQVSAGWLYRFLTFGKTDSAFLANHSTPSSSAHFLTLSADAGFWVGPRFLIGGRYAGQSVLSTTFPESVDPSRFPPPFGDKDNELDAVRHVAGPFVLLRVDDRLDIKGGSYSTFAGKNTYHFDQFWVALAFKQTKLNRLQGFLGSARP